MLNILIVVLSCISLLGGCSRTDNDIYSQEKNGNKPKAEYRKISAEKAYEMLSVSNEIILLDVRTEQEYKAKRIVGAMLLPVTEIKNRAAQELPDKNAVILVYCQGGVRSKSAAEELVSMGYVNVYDFGGINDWPFDTVSG